MELETQAAFDPASFEHIPVLLNESGGSFH